MFIVLFTVVVFFTKLPIEDFPLFDSSCLFCCSEVPSLNGKVSSDVISKHNIAVSIAIQSDMGFLCCILLLLLDQDVRILLCTDDAMDALFFASAAH